MYGVILILVLIITGGAIAFIGDRLGSKVGKKKMRIFGLRPKHSSILITIVTGVMITTFTLGIMSIISENVRTALFGMEQLNQNMQQTKSQLEASLSELADVKAEDQRIQGELNDAVRELAGLEAQRDDLLLQTEKLQTVNDGLANDNRQLTDTNLALTGNNEKLTRLNVILEEGNERLKENNEELEQVNQDLNSGIQRIREGSIAFQAGETLAGGIIKGDRTLEEISADMGVLLTQARDTVAGKLGDAVDDRFKDVWVYPQDFEEATKYIADHEGEFVVRIVAAGNLIQGEPVAVTLQLYQNKTVYQDGQLITEKLVEFNPNNPAELQGALTGFLSELNAKAREDGILPDEVNGSVGVIDAEHFYDVLDQLQKSGGKALISAFAEGTTNVLGPLRITLKLAGILP